MNATDISCGCCAAQCWCPDDGVTACSDWVSDGCLLIFDEVELKPLTVWSRAQVKAHDDILAAEDAEIFYHLNEGRFVVRNEMEIC